MGAKAVGLDIDNTLAPDGTLKFIDGAQEWIDSIRAAGFPITIISNGTIFRVGPIAKKFGLPFVPRRRQRPSPCRTAYAHRHS